jgi:membrane protease YdiL (CAAX protease family)
VGAVAALVHGQRRGLVRWRPAAVVGGTVGVLMAAAGLNQLPLSWAGYDTATSPATFVTARALGALAGGAASGLWVMVAVAAAELLTRRAFPRHHDWYAYPRHAGAPAVAGRVLGGYALAAFGFLYVTLFYLSTRSALGWWVPTESLDDPNAIATPLPWVDAIGTSLFAGTWEEAIFRAVPLALLSLWVRDRPGRRWWMAAGVVVTALAFGFGHANYPSWPAYSRGVELFAEAALVGGAVPDRGLPTTIVAHVLYDLGWFGLFALHGSGPAYRMSAVAVLLAGALPALTVAVGWWRARSAPAGAGGLAGAVPLLGDWRPAGRPAATEDAEAASDVAAPANAGRPAPAGLGAAVTAPVSSRLRAAAALVVAAGVLAAVFVPPARQAGPRYTAARAAVARAADSALRARGVDPAAWSRTLVTDQTAHGVERRFLRDTVGRVRAAELARRLAATYLLPAQWRRGTSGAAGRSPSAARSGTCWSRQTAACGGWSTTSPTTRPGPRRRPTRRARSPARRSPPAWPGATSTRRA